MRITSGLFVVGSVMVVIVYLTVWCRICFKVTFSPSFGVVRNSLEILLEDVDAKINGLKLTVAANVLSGEIRGLVAAFLLHGFTCGNGVVVGLASLILVFLGVWDVFIELHLVSVLTIEFLLVL
jgi:hypothetical protein